jgi:hypothetical protein
VTACNTDVYGNLFTVFRYFNLHVGGLIRVLIFMCVLTSLCSLLTRSSEILPSWWRMGYMLLFVVLARYIWSSLCLLRRGSHVGRCTYPVCLTLVNFGAVTNCGAFPCILDERVFFSVVRWHSTCN